MTYPLLPRLFRPYLLRELPGPGRPCGWLGLGGRDNTNPRWRDRLVLTSRGKPHGDRGDRGLVVSLGGSRCRRRVRLRPVARPEGLGGEIDAPWPPARCGRFDPTPYLDAMPSPAASSGRPADR